MQNCERGIDQKYVCHCPRFVSDSSSINSKAGSGQLFTLQVLPFPQILSTSPLMPGHSLGRGERLSWVQYSLSTVGLLVSVQLNQILVE